VLATAEAICSRVFNGPVSLSLACPNERGGTHAHRCRLLDPPPGAPGSIVLKQYRPARRGMGVNEWVALEFLRSGSSRPLGIASAYGFDATSDTVVLDDLGQGLTLEEVLLDETRQPEAVEGLLRQWAVLLATVHASSFGRAAEFAARRRAAGPPSGFQLWIDSLGPKLRALPAVLALCSVGTSSALQQELLLAISDLAEPAALEVLTHGDWMPHNACLFGEQLVLLDFETARFRHALLDVAVRVSYPMTYRLPFALPRHSLDGIESAYWERLAETSGRKPTREDYRRGRWIAYAGWCAHAFSTIPSVLSADREFHACSLRERVLASLLEFVTAARDDAPLPALREATHSALVGLASRWEIQPRPLDCFPALRVHSNGTPP
jgi:hypothetical protein